MQPAEMTPLSSQGTRMTHPRNHSLGGQTVAPHSSVEQAERANHKQRLRQRFVACSAPGATTPIQAPPVLGGKRYAERTSSSRAWNLESTSSVQSDAEWVSSHRTVLPCFRRTVAGHAVETSAFSVAVTAAALRLSGTTQLITWYTAFMHEKTRSSTEHIGSLPCIA